jgi:hypothetical protein
MNTEALPARVNGKIAREVLGIADKETFRKVVDANPQVVHRLAGEVRPKYLTRELLALLRSVPGVRALGDNRTP